jgi:hypothetical protein
VANGQWQLTITRKARLITDLPVTIALEIGEKVIPYGRYPDIRKKPHVINAALVQGMKNSLMSIT